MSRWGMTIAPVIPFLIRKNGNEALDFPVYIAALPRTSYSTKHIRWLMSRAMTFSLMNINYRTVIRLGTASCWTRYKACLLQSPARGRNRTRAAVCSGHHDVVCISWAGLIIFSHEMLGGKRKKKKRKTLVTPAQLHGECVWSRLNWNLVFCPLSLQSFFSRTCVVCISKRISYLYFEWLLNTYVLYPSK